MEALGGPKNEPKMSRMSQKPNGGKRDMYKVLFVCTPLRVGGCVFTFDTGWRPYPGVCQQGTAAGRRNPVGKLPCLRTHLLRRYAHLKKISHTRSTHDKSCQPCQGCHPARRELSPARGKTGTASRRKFLRRGLSRFRHQVSESGRIDMVTP